MERICTVCNQSKKTPYKNICRNCYQKQWAQTIPEKRCIKCSEMFRGVGKSCNHCYANGRNEKTRLTPCKGCQRVGLLILNKTEKLCTKCDRCKKEAANPSLAQKRRDATRKSNRKSRGTDLDAPIRKSKGWWLTASGYVLIYDPNHENSDINGCVFEHIYVMSNHLMRALKKGETVHHINGLRDDNRIENLEIWHRSHPPGQRLDDKIQWAKKFLEDYGFEVTLKS